MEKSFKIGVKKNSIDMISTLWFIKENKTRLHKNLNIFTSNDTMKEIKKQIKKQTKKKKANLEKIGSKPLSIK